MKYILMASTAAAMLTACGMPANEPAADDTATTESTPAATGGVARETTVVRDETPVERVAVSVMASQPGSDGIQVDLLSARVTGDVMTLTFRCSSEERIKTKLFNVGQISVIDDATSQRIGVLKDDGGNWMASSTRTNHMSTGCEIQPGVFWARFPAPPATSPTISISLPDVAPFDGIAVTR